MKSINHQPINVRPESYATATTTVPNRSGSGLSDRRSWNWGLALGLATTLLISVGGWAAVGITIAHFLKLK